MASAVCADLQHAGQTPGLPCRLNVDLNLVPRSCTSHVLRRSPHTTSVRSLHRTYSLTHGPVLESVASLQRLRHLALRDMNVPPEALSHPIAQSLQQGLQSLDLSGVPVTVHADASLCVSVLMLPCASQC